MDALEKAVEILDRYPEIKEYRDAERRVQEALKCREETLKKWGEYIKIWDSLRGEHVVEVPSRIDPRVQEFQSLAKYFLSLAYPDRKFRFSPMRPTDVLEISEKGGKEYWVSAWKFLKKPVGDEELDRMREELARDPSDIEKLREFLSRAYPDLEFRVDPERPGYVLLKTPRKVERKWIRVGRLIERAEVPEDLQELKEKLMKEITRMPPPPKTKKYILEISTRPEDVLRKSLYEFVDISCEKPGGHWEEGPFSDVCNYNAIGLIKDESGKTIGRIMLRWCLDENGEPDIGVEIVYPRNAKWGPKFKDALVRYLKERGFLDYKRCETPYAYKGYTDVGEKVDSRIVYHEHGTGEDYLRTRASSPDITYAEALLISSEGSREIRRVLADNPAVLKFERVVKRLLRDIDEWVARNMADLVVSQGEKIEFSCDEVKTFNKIAQVKLIPKIPEECACEIARKLAEDDALGIREIVAYNVHKLPEKCACDIARKLSEDRFLGVRGNLAYNIHELPEECSCELARKLAEDMYPDVRKRVSSHVHELPEECACEIARKLADDDEYVVKENVAYNLGELPEECACEIARKLADDDEYVVRGWVAHNLGKLPEECACELARKLADDGSWEVRNGVAYNLGELPEECACEIARKLADDKNLEVRKAIVESFDRLPKECECDVAKKAIKGVEDASAANLHKLSEECACEIAEMLANDQDPLVRRCIAMHLNQVPKKCRCEIAEKLADDYYYNNRRWVAVNLDSLPRERRCKIAEKLVGDNSPDVRLEVANNLHELPEECRCDIARELADDKANFVRLGVARRLGDLPEECACEIARKLAKDKDPDVKATARSEVYNLPEECREEIRALIFRRRSNRR